MTRRVPRIQVYLEQVGYARTERQVGQFLFVLHTYMQRKRNLCTPLNRFLNNFIANYPLIPKLKYSLLDAN